MNEEVKFYGIKCLLGNQIVDETPRTLDEAQTKCDDLTRKAHMAGFFDMDYLPVPLKKTKI